MKVPSAADLLRLRDETVPSLVAAGRLDAMTELAGDLWESLLSAAIPYEDKRLRDEIIIVILWIECLAVSPPQLPPEKPAHTVAELAQHIDADIDQESVTTWTAEWVLTPGSQLHPECVALAAGRQLGSRACIQLGEYAVRVHRAEDTDNIVCQMARFFEKSAELNTFERTNDTFLFEVCRSYLSVARQATLAYREGPLKVLPDQFEAGTNGLVRPLVERNAAEMLQGVAWKSVRNPDIFILLSVLLREQCDGLTTGLQVLSNNNVTVHQCAELRALPQLYVLTAPAVRDDVSVYGIVYKRTFHFMAAHTQNAMLHIYLLYLRMAKQAAEATSEFSETAASLGQLLEAIVNSDRIELTNPFAKLF